MKLIETVKSKVNSGSERSIKAKKNILRMLLLKGGNILIGLLLVPMTLSYVDSATYGVWLALSSMIAWISFFDIGINNGLKNKLTEAFAKGDNILCKKYVSTTYAILSIIFIPLMILLLIVSPFINWESLLNLPHEATNGLLASIAVIITYFCINFILSTINVVLLADQKPADSSLRQFIQQITSLAIIWILTLTTKGSLLLLCIGLCVSPIIIIAIFNYTLFRGRYNRISPSVKEVDFNVAPDLLKLGVQFFVIQIAAIIQYQMINFLLLRYYGASEVTSYNIGYKYFSILTMVWGILMAPIWAAVTDAVTINDYAWIKNTIKKFLKLFVLFTGIGIIMLMISPLVYYIWLGNKVEISFILSTWIFVYNVVLMFANIFVNIINGTGKLKVQLIASCISPFVFFGVFFGLYSMGIGVYSVLIAAIISNFNGLILAPLQCRNMLSKR